MTDCRQRQARLIWSRGGKGLLMFFPLSGQSDGFLVAVLRTQEWLDHVLEHEIYGAKEDFRVTVSINSTLLYQQPGWDDVTDIGYQAITTAQFMGHSLEIRLLPTQAFIDNCRTWAPFLVGVFGVLMSLTIGLIVFLDQKAGREARKAELASAISETATRNFKTTNDNLQQVLSRLNLATTTGQIGIWTWDIKTNQLIWNQQMFVLFGIPPDVIPTFETWKGTLHPEDTESTIALLWAAVEGRAVFDTRFRIRLASGEERYIRARAQIERDQVGKAIFVTGINMDISDRLRREEALQKSEEMTRLLLDSTSQPIYGIDTHGKCTFANQACVETLGYHRVERLIGQNMHQLIHHSHENGSPIAETDCHIFRAFAENRGTHRDDEVLWRADGTCFKAEYWSHPQTLNGKVIGAAVLFSDISDRKLREEQALHMATHDHLTGLPNVRLANDRLSVALGLSKRNRDIVAVMFLDLDGFKSINDSFGHDAGDEVLRQVAQRLLIGLRSTDTAARIGGDEFLVVAGGLHSPENAAGLAQKLIQLVAQPILHLGELVPIGISIGLALFPNHSNEQEDLIKLADNAMYLAKKKGSNRFCFSEAVPKADQGSDPA